MVERPAVFEICQIGAEGDDAYGTAVAADTRLASLSLAPAIQNESQSFRPSGYLFPTVALQNREWTQLSLSGVADYNELAYVFCGLFVEATPTGASDAKTWSWEPASDGANDRTSYTAEFGGDYTSAEDAEVPGVMFTDFNIDFARNAIEIGGAALGQLYDTTGGITADISDSDPVPMMPKDVDVYLDSASGDLGSTQIDALRVSISFSGMVVPKWVLNSSETSFKSLLDAAPDGQVTIRLEADSTAMGYLSNLRAGDKRFLRISATSDVVAESGSPDTYYSMQFDTCIQYVDVNEFSDEDGVYAVEYVFDVAHDATWGKALSWQLVNTLAAV
jgi:hypothetical protein